MRAYSLLHSAESQAKDARNVHRDSQDGEASVCESFRRVPETSGSLHSRWMNGISEEASWIISALSVGTRPGAEAYQLGVSA